MRDKILVIQNFIVSNALRTACD